MSYVAFYNVKITDTTSFYFSIYIILYLERIENVRIYDSRILYLHLAFDFLLLLYYII